MLIIIALAIICTVGTIIAVNSYRELWELSAGLIAILSGTALFLCLLALPINYYGRMADVQKYNAFKTTIAKARQTKASEIERAAVLMQIAKWNQELASAKYWNKTLFDIWIPDEYAKLPPLE
ncbi:MAG: hypothetical protein ABFD82_18000 [Syntrophaceae bacterium]